MDRPPSRRRPPKEMNGLNNETIGRSPVRMYCSTPKPLLEWGKLEIANFKEEIYHAGSDKPR